MLSRKELEADSTVQLTVIANEEVTIEVAPPATLMDALESAGIFLTAPCGGQGTCGKCRVQVRGKVSAPTASELERLRESQMGDGFRLACQTQVLGSATVHVPPASRASQMRILLGGASRKVVLDPALVKRFVSLPSQTLDGAVSEADLLVKALDLRADLRADYAVLRQLPGVLRGAEGKLTAVACDDRIIAIEPGDTSDRAYGLALDVGTTTVVGTVVDLRTGKDLAAGSAVNGQTKYGHDVIARIKFSIETDEGLVRLQEAVRDTVNRVLTEVVLSAEISPDEIYEVAVVGNATMSHLLLGVPPDSLGRLPYAPVFSSGINVSASDLGFDLNPRANVYVLPNIAGFVGADTVGAILASGFDEPDGKVRMLADVGTNCEIVLRKGDDLLACSTPAGPAFEGAKISHGMYARNGAIEEVHLDKDCTYKVIGRKKPQGLCGSGLVDVGAELLRVGIVDRTGRMLPPEELPAGLPQALRDRVVQKDGKVQFIIASSESGEPITLTERDMRELQLAKGAVRTGIEVLLQRTGISLADLDELCIAGGFGSYLGKESAIRLGLIPDLPLERIRIVGNAAIGGAKLALISREMRRRAATVSRAAQHIQIADTPDFQTQFMEAMMF
jgi:uncharacterized 2Fe-2S/4Fe-4S cluster protein (DUF4445 family)